MSKLREHIRQNISFITFETTLNEYMKKKNYLGKFHLFFPEEKLNVKNCKIYEFN
jgi:hypothetical protein